MKRSAVIPTTLDGPGLCGTCHHAHRIVTDQGSTFWRCLRFKTDATYPRYPRLPVRACTGHDAKRSRSRRNQSCRFTVRLGAASVPH